jgi:hypothetical protein
MKHFLLGIGGALVLLLVMTPIVIIYFKFVGWLAHAMGMFK